ncbi:hypothetical protein NIES4101_32600 [Calothrix sp. NIES-4101]|nr:hypothetical protein NIES4101_32600 [Calothrix sp. NIES-4101]
MHSVTGLVTQSVEIMIALGRNKPMILVEELVEPPPTIRRRIYAAFSNYLVEMALMT